MNRASLCGDREQGKLPKWRPQWAKARVDHTESTTHTNDREMEQAAGPQLCEMDQVGRTLGQQCAGDFETLRLSLVKFQKHYRAIRVLSQRLECAFHISKINLVAFCRSEIHHNQEEARHRQWAQYRYSGVHQYIAPISCMLRQEDC